MNKLCRKHPPNMFVSFHKVRVYQITIITTLSGCSSLNTRGLLSNQKLCNPNSFIPFQSEFLISVMLRSHIILHTIIIYRSQNTQKGVGSCRVKDTMQEHRQRAGDMAQW